MDDALHTDDLDPAAVHTLDHLARLLRMVRLKGRSAIAPEIGSLDSDSSGLNFCIEDRSLRDA